MFDPIACRDCGVVNDDATRLFDELQRKIRNQQETIEGLQEQLSVIERVNTNLQVQKKKLRAEGDKQLKGHKYYPDAMEVLEDWRDKCHPGAIELEGERLKKVLARLSAGYSKDQLKRCAFGYSKFPYVVSARRQSQGTPAQRRIDAELVFRDPQHVDQGLALAQEADRRNARMPNLAPPPKDQKLVAMGQAAVELAEAGFYVFPVIPNGKVPASRNGFKDATRDVERITRFWLNNPLHNIGIRCGIESDLVVLDIDQLGFDSLTDLERRYGDLPNTFSVVTPRGGQHYYFRHPGEDEKVLNTTGYPGEGLDIRGDGGYVLAPPSMGATGKRYAADSEDSLCDLPEWLLTLLRNRQKLNGGRIDSSEWEAMFTRGMAPGERNSKLLSYTGHLWSLGVSPGEILGLVGLVNRHKCDPPLPDREVQKIIESVRKMREREAGN